MGKVISLVNQKGGVGKTTTSINLSSALGHLGKKVLLIDFDPQSNSTTGLGLNKADISKSVYDVIMHSCDIKEAILKTKFKNLSVIPSMIYLSGAEMELMQNAMTEQDYIIGDQLKLQIDTIRDRYDYILIDCPPTLGVLTTNALAASDSVLIPVQCEYYSLEGVTQLLNTILLTQSKINPKLENTMNNVGFLLLMILMVYITFQDIIKLF